METRVVLQARRLAEKAGGGFAGGAGGQRKGRRRRAQAARRVAALERLSCVWASSYRRRLLLLHDNFGDRVWAKALLRGACVTGGGCWKE